LNNQKILVKEVKTLRTQLDSLRDERDLYHNQLQLMREALGLGSGLAGSAVSATGVSGGQLAFYEREQGRAVGDSGSLREESTKAGGNMRHQRGLK
jgi:hypothetical protein